MSQPEDFGPAELIAKDGRPLHVLAVAAGTAASTILAAKKSNQWPKQHRVRTGLRRALGLPDEPRPAFPRQADTPEAVTAEIERMQQHGAQPSAPSMT